MRIQGTLIKWQDDRGFGFIRTRDSGIELFAHVSEFPRTGRRPQIGDALSFEIRTGEDGRKQAHTITYDLPTPRADASPQASPPSRPSPASRAHAPTRPHAHRPARGGHERSSSPLLPAALAITGLLGLGAYGWDRFGGQGGAAIETFQGSPTVAPSPAEDAGKRCDGRTHCSQMRSCEDATWVLKHCPSTSMDGDGDGVPCEQQWCG
jgi:cold shock CspA family protein